MSRKGGFDTVASVYDALSYMVFGNDLRKAQQAFIHKLPAEGTVLIIGGGAGWILKEVITRRPQLKIHYVEASAKMLELSKKRVSDHERVSFIHGTEKSIPTRNYDCIITNFFLDVFSEDDLIQVMLLLRQKLSPEGIWLCTDFRATDRASHKFLIWLMHHFFRLFSSLDAKKLLDFRPCFVKADMRLKEEKTLRRGLIFSAVYCPSE